MFLVSILTVFFIIVAAAMILIILVQRPQGGGLSGAFGGAGGGSDTVFGGRTGDALTLATVICFVLFLGLSIGLNVIDVTPATQGATNNAADGTTAPADGTLPIDQTQGGPTLPPGSSPQTPLNFPQLPIQNGSPFPSAPSGNNGAQTPVGPPSSTEPGPGAGQPE